MAHSNDIGWQCFLKSAKSFAAPELPVDIIDVMDKCEMVAQGWFCGVQQNKDGFIILKMPNDIFSLDSAGWTFNPNDTLNTFVNPTFASSFIFYCEFTGSIHYFFSQDAFLYTAYSKSDSTCGIVAYANIKCRAAGNYVDPYPNEYRPPAYYADSIFCVPLPGYYPVGGWLQNSCVNPQVLSTVNYFTTPAINSNGYIPVSVYDVGIPNCRNENNATDTTLLVGDNFVLQEVWLLYNTIYCDTSIAIDADTTITITARNIVTNCNIAIDCSDSIAQNYGVNQQFTTQSNMAVNYAPAITLSAQQHHICWNCTITNNQIIADSVNGHQVLTGAASHIFVSHSNFSFLSNWYMVINTTDTIYAANNIFDVQQFLPTNGIINATICAQYDTCKGAFDVVFAAGNDCNTYPLSEADIANMCHVFNDTIHVIDATSNLFIAANNDTIHYSSCDTIHRTVQFYTRQGGNMYPDSIEITNSLPGTYILTVTAGPCSSNNAFHLHHLSMVTELGL
nr:hypothetical protein [Bacteroidota bacterium]